MEIFDSEELKKYLDADYPLLQKFKAMAPGTFRHTQSVMGLVEAVASDLDLDVTFMKVCAQYHDVGKIWNPQYFTENQSGENPHDKLEPHISYQIITRHISDSIAILTAETDMPREIMKVIIEHHGDTILKSICMKSESKNEDSFRYNTPKPSSVYSSLLMIADAVEATAKSQADKLITPESKIRIVKDTIDRLREDEQLDEMKVGILRQVQQRLIRELDGIYHTRLDYIEEKGEKENES